MAFKYYAEYLKPIVQQGETTNYTWFMVTETYNNKPAAVAAAEATSQYRQYDMRIVKSSWEVAESLPKTA